MIITMRYPGGKNKALTLSYDDGTRQDERLIALMDAHGVKGTFNLNSGTFTDSDAPIDPHWRHNRFSMQEAQRLYGCSPHEVAVHTLTHPDLVSLPTALAAREVLDDRQALEALFARPIRGMAYPYGTYSDAVIDILKSCDIAYCRTVVSTRHFNIPTNWLALHPTCHHNDAALFDLADAFLNEKRKFAPVLFYLWGHSFEFDGDNNWQCIEDFLKRTSARDDVWYATNIEIYNYAMAYERLEFSIDAKYVRNPSAAAVWIAVGNDIREIPAGCVVSL